jgi:hypothetical protein
MLQIKVLLECSDHNKPFALFLRRIDLVAPGVPELLSESISQNQVRSFDEPDGAHLSVAAAAIAVARCFCQKLTQPSLWTAAIRKYAW